MRRYCVTASVQNGEMARRTRSPAGELTVTKWHHDSQPNTSFSSERAGARFERGLGPIPNTQTIVRNQQTAKPSSSTLGFPKLVD
jgi:hypothetical protein